MPAETKGATRRGATLPAYISNDYNTVFYRLQRLMSELNQRKNGQAAHPAMLSESLEVTETASECIALAQALAAAIDAAFPL